MKEKSNQLKRLVEILELRGFVKNEFDDYKNTMSLITFICDKGHVCKTKARYLLYGNVGCKTCQYDKKKSILNIELKNTTYKICNSCNEKKSKSYFGKLSSSLDGLRNMCNMCRRKQYSFEYNDENIKKRREDKSLKYCKENPFRVLLSRCKSNHNKKGMTGFNITEEFLSVLYIKQEGKCFWSGIPLPLDNIGLGELNSISVDRLDPSKGYLIDNVILSCKFYNLGRGNMNVEDFTRFLIKNNLVISNDLIKN